MQQKIKTTVKDSLVYSVGTISRDFVAIFLIPVYTRVFSPTAFGIIAGVKMVIPIIRTLIFTPPQNSTARFYNDSKDPQDRKLIASAGLYQIIFSALLLILPLVLIFPQELSALTLQDSTYGKYFILALITLFFTVIGTYGLTMLRLNFRSMRYTVISIIQILVEVGLTILLVVELRMDITGALAAPLITSIPFCLVLMWLTRKYYSKSLSTPRLKEMLTFGVPLIPVAILGYILTYADRYFIINYCSLADLGLYQIGVYLASIITVLFAGFHVAWTPILWSTFRDADAKSFYSRISDYAFSVAILAIVAVSLFSREILTVFATGAYVEAYQVVPWLAFGLLFTQVFSWFVPGVGVARKTIHHVWRAAVAVGVNIGLNFLLVPRYGMVGAAIGTLIASVVSYVLRLVMSQRYYPIHFNFAGYLKITTVAVAMLALWYNFLLEISWQNILIKLGFMLLVVVSLFVFKMIGRSELSYAKKAAVRYFRKLRQLRPFH